MQRVIIMVVAKLYTSRNAPHQGQPQATSARQRNRQTQGSLQSQLPLTNAEQGSVNKEAPSDDVRISRKGLEQLGSRAAAPGNESIAVRRSPDMDAQEVAPPPEEKEPGAAMSNQAAVVPDHSPATDNAAPPVASATQQPSRERDVTSAQPANAEQNTARQNEQAERQIINNQAIQGYQNGSLRSRINGSRIDEAV